MQTTKKLAASLACVLALLGAPSAAGYAQLTVFGDSLSDGGNVFLFSGGTFPPPPYAQRLSNGPTAVEVMAANLGLPLMPSLLPGGRNYAYGGADTGVGNYFSVYPGVPTEIHTLFGGSPFPETGVLAQVQSFIGSGGTIAPDGLTVLWAGPNDVFTAITLNQDPVNDAIFPALANLTQEVITLYGAGARTILLPNMPDLGSIPFGLMSADPAGLTGLSVLFNLLLEQAIDQLEPALPGLDIIEFDTFSFVDAAISNPAAFGFTNVTDPCFNGVSVCANPNQYVFWDTVHPSARSHQLLGNAFAVAVPEPGTLVLVAFALGALGFSRRRGTLR